MINVHHYENGQVKEFSANDINQLIAANKKASGKAFVTIDKNVLHAQVAIPLKKLKFGDRQLIISGDVHASAERDPHKLSITNLSLGGVDFPDYSGNYRRRVK